MPRGFSTILNTALPILMKSMAQQRQNESEWEDWKRKEDYRNNVKKDLTLEGNRGMQDAIAKLIAGGQTSTELNAYEKPQLPTPGFQTQTPASWLADDPQMKEYPSFVTEQKKVFTPYDEQSIRAIQLGALPYAANASQEYVALMNSLASDQAKRARDAADYPVEFQRKVQEAVTLDAQKAQARQAQYAANLEKLRAALSNPNMADADKFKLYNSISDNDLRGAIEREFTTSGVERRKDGRIEEVTNFFGQKKVVRSYYPQTGGGGGRSGGGREAKPTKDAIENLNAYRKSYFTARQSGGKETTARIGDMYGAHISAMLGEEGKNVLGEWYNSTSPDGSKKKFDMGDKIDFAIYVNDLYKTGKISERTYVALLHQYSYTWGETMSGLPVDNGGDAGK